MTRSATLLVCWMLALAAAAVHAGPAPVMFTECIARLDRQADVGFAHVAARCPELVQQLREGDWAAWLPRGWMDPGNDLSADGLRELERLGRLGSQERHQGQVPQLRSLSQVLDHLPRSEEGRWSSLQRWLRSSFEPEVRVHRGSDSGLLARLNISATSVEVLAATALAATLAFFAWILISEWRGTRSARPGARPSVPATEPGGERAIREADPQPVRAQPRGWMERPRELLALLLAELARRRDLPPTGALTVRELTSMARLVDAQRRQLVALAVAAERVRFAATPPAQIEVEHCVDEGERLLHELRGPNAA